MPALSITFFLQLTLKFQRKRTSLQSVQSFINHSTMESLTSFIIQDILKYLLLTGTETLKLQNYI